MQTIKLFHPPVPVNAKYGVIGGRMLLSKKYRDAKEALTWEMKSQWKKQPMSGDVVLNVVQYFGDNRKRDIDAFLKIILDAGCGVLYEDDSQVVELNVVKAKDLEKPRVEISVV